jgi:hypothetical protein
VFATVTLQPLAVYVVPLVPYVAETTLPDTGPKFVPVNVIVAPPLVDRAEPPATLLITGAVYDSLADDAALAWLPTVTTHTRFAPTPTTLTHVIVLLSRVTAHDVAVYSMPVAPYVALTGLLAVGPKLDPDIVTVLPPAVISVPDKAEIAGAA